MWYFCTYLVFGNGPPQLTRVSPSVPPSPPPIQRTMHASQIPDEAWEAIDDFRVSLEIFDRGKLSRLLLRSLNPSEVASNNFLEIRSWPKVSPTSSSDIMRGLW